MTAVMEPFARVPAGRDRAPQGSTNVNRTQFPYGDAFTNTRHILSSLRWNEIETMPKSFQEKQIDLFLALMYAWNSYWSVSDLWFKPGFLKVLMI